MNVTAQTNNVPLDFNFCLQTMQFKKFDEFSLIGWDRRCLLLAGIAKHGIAKQLVNEGKGLCHWGE